MWSRLRQLVLAGFRSAGLGVADVGQVGTVLVAFTRRLARRVEPLFDPFAPLVHVFPPGHGLGGEFPAGSLVG